MTEDTLTEVVNLGGLPTFVHLIHNRDWMDICGISRSCRVGVIRDLRFPLVMVDIDTTSNIDFLVTNGYVTQGEAAAPAPGAPAVVQAKALWAYDLDASDRDDLSFTAGNIITIVEETNADWWLGEYGGPGTPTPAPVPRTLPPAFTPPTGVRSVPPAPTEKKEYKPFMATHSSANAPPPPGAGTNSVGLQQDAGQDGKKSKFGKYGNTMAHSAAGGVGLGAGAAIGGGLVRSIF
ncbi:uncharacterized protein BT62DRAFT_996866 [Guyanagaster necrorhizus]|uniref:SH3 domain-containing protein n=1 Tax=Guyanagaster necrorhizus TaxID=856835 RepID=A0A9P8ANH3_9AGAR|nr:uncharacterized protein BT62DRAFT_996866 [Guyanagaster necrorhizus MCA 3950]KAG7441905.1 hypothetical protein BT62DRAFT_996866 [Guyanagaster necrorhizus MCA 3950]